MVEAILGFVFDKILLPIFSNTSFKYKFNPEIIKLYRENCEKVYEALEEITRSGKVSNETENKILEAYLEAKTYLHKDIVEFTEDIRKKSLSLKCILNEIEPLPVGEKRTKKCAEMLKLNIYLDDKRFETRNVYRKCIVNEPFAKFRKKQIS